VAEVLGGDWAGVEPDKVLATQTFFVDVMRNAPALELTVRCWPWLNECASLIHRKPVTHAARTLPASII